MATGMLRHENGATLAKDLTMTTFGLVGCVYILRSARAKATFVRRHGAAPGEQPETPIQPDAVDGSSP